MERHGEAWRGMERQKEAKKKKKSRKNNIGESKEKT